jgi:hypothetical protein
VGEQGGGSGAILGDERHQSAQEDRIGQVGKRVAAHGRDSAGAGRGGPSFLSRPFPAQREPRPREKTESHEISFAADDAGPAAGL